LRRRKWNLPAAAALAVLSSASGRVRAQSSSVEIWMRAFIPSPQHAGTAAQPYVVPNPSGAGSLVRLLAATSEFPNQCFATDHRGFDATSQSTARLDTRFSIRLLAGTGTAAVLPSVTRTTASITRKVNCASGVLLQEGTGSVDRDTVGVPSVANATVQVAGQIQGRNLLTPLGGSGPSIDYSFDIQWAPETASLTTRTTHGSFPAFEVYARQPGGVWVAVQQQLPTGTPWSLGGDSFGLNVVSAVSTVTIAGARGAWKTPLPERRFALEVSWGKAKWTEMNAAGATLTREVELKELPDGTFRIERPNDAGVLAFLGFQPSLRAEILARNPRPSFMILTLIGSALRGDWNGLMVTKDSNARLRELIQPGSRPPRSFAFVRAEEQR
jgi:hypothetical protein